MLPALPRSPNPCPSVCTTAQRRPRYVPDVTHCVVLPVIVIDTALQQGQPGAQLVLGEEGLSYTAKRYPYATILRAKVSSTAHNRCVSQ